jgi:hypothetical protein
MTMIYAKKDEDAAALRALFAGKETWPPPNLKPCTERDYWHYRSIWFSFKAEAWMGHVPALADGSHATAMLFYVGHGEHIDGGFAVLNVYSPASAQRVEYFTWGACDHEFTQKTIGNCLTRYMCTKCKKFHDVDSSD